MGESGTPHVYDFGILGHDPEPLHQYRFIFETQRYLTFEDLKADNVSLCGNMLWKQTNTELLFLGERRVPHNPDDPPNEI